jgi:hypothetical protein
LRKTYRTASQQMLEMSPTFSKTNTHPLQRVSCNFAKYFWVTVDNSLFNIVFQFLQASLVIGINSSFEKYPQKKTVAG